MIHKNIRVLAWFNFFTDFKLYAPIAIIYFAGITGSFALGMSIFSITMISSALFEVPTGIFSDRIGRKKTVIFGALAAVVYSLLYAVGMSFWVLAVGALFEGLSRSFYSGNNDALLYDSLAESKKEHQYDEFLGKTSAMFQLALAVSAILGGLLAIWSLSYILWLSVIPQALCFFLSLKLKEPKIQTAKSGNLYQHLNEASSKFIRNKKLRLLSLASILTYGFGETGYQFQAAFYNTLWPYWAIGIAKTLSNLGATLSFHFSGKLIKRFNSLKILIAANIYNRFISIVATIFPTILSPLLMSSTSLSYGVTSVAKSSLMQKEFTNEQRATMGSLNSFAGNIFFGFLSISLGLLADQINPTHALLTLQIFQISNIFLFWLLFKHDTGRNS